jgi:hypothetical protein
MNGADPNPELPHPLVDDGNDGGSGDGGGGGNVGGISEDEDGKDDGAVSGPTIEAYVELAKTSCTFLLLDISRAR